MWDLMWVIEECRAGQRVPISSQLLAADAQASARLLRSECPWRAYRLVRT